MIDLNHEATEAFQPNYSFRSSIAQKDKFQQKQAERKTSNYQKAESEQDLNSRSNYNQSFHTKNSPSLFEFIARVKNNSVHTAPAEAQSLDTNPRRIDGDDKTGSEISARSQDELLKSRFGNTKERSEKIKSTLTGSKTKPTSFVKDQVLPLKVQTPQNLSSVLFDPKQMSFKRQTMTVNFLKEKLGEDFEDLKALYIKNEGNLSEVEKKVSPDKISFIRLFPIAFGFATPTTQGSLNFSSRG